jgi:hypothetical protein
MHKGFLFTCLLAPFLVFSPLSAATSSAPRIMSAAELAAIGGSEIPCATGTCTGHAQRSECTDGYLTACTGRSEKGCEKATAVKYYDCLMCVNWAVSGGPETCNWFGKQPCRDEVQCMWNANEGHCYLPTPNTPQPITADFDRCP